MIKLGYLSIHHPLAYVHRPTLSNLPPPLSLLPPPSADQLCAGTSINELVSKVKHQ